jgi:hypothetical protein
MAATKKPAAKELDVALANWTTTNEFLRDATETEAQAALEHEKKGKHRLQYMLRIHARLNKTRAERERAELVAVTA